ncbi:hypothetical protein [Polynucleobacter antarcticus]|uniref:Amino acid transporter n=1 Tax=Polynucleobacter antarcticus TaxID=1743162 RepID=A0A6M9Q0F3_9BURK|nr:hypothetical protein [Polynucleobacter antarcticus]QKM63526.1 hypothetical protein DCO16_11045 [Polynucleobacter antarcticus]
MPIKVGLDRVLNLPPFWLSFAFMALVSLPMSYVAFPITAAPLGVLPSLGIIALLTLVMCTTTAAIAEAIVLIPPESRPKNLHDLVVIYLGKRAGTITALAITVIFFVVLLACNISIIETLNAFTGWSKYLSLSIFGVVTLLVISFGSIAHSLSLVAGAIAILVMITIIVALIPFVDIDRILYFQLPFTNNFGLAPNIWSGFLGVMILSFIGPLLLVPSAMYVLPRNPEAHLFIKGSLWGIVFQALLMGLWIIAVDLTLLPGQLIGLHGTVLIELGEVTNPLIKVMGAVLVLILPGLAAIRSAAQLGVQVNIFFKSSKQVQDGNIRIFNQYILPAIPTLAALLLVAILVDIDKADVSIFLSIGGILGSTIATGIIPIMLYKAVIQKNIKPHLPLLGFFRSRLLMILNLTFFIIILLLYGLVVWDSLIIQVLACLISVVAISQLLKIFTVLK